MAWTNWGFDGTINEAQWSKMANLLGSSGGTYMAAGNGDCLVTAVGGSRAVSVAAGTLYGDGVVSVNDAAETVAMTTPVNGQWYVIALRRTWSSNTAALVAIAGATTTTTTPTAPPTSFPTMNTDQGVLTDQPIAWAWCNSANTTVVVYDLRLKGVKSTPPVVLTQAERDAKFPAPTQGVQVWRDDLGAVETYFGLYNASTNPGGRDAAGWYVNDRQTSLIQVRPGTVSVASGSATVNAMGTITFTGATALNINGIFSDKYRWFKIVFTEMASSTSTAVSFRARSGATDVTSTSYYWAATASRVTSTSFGSGSANNTKTEFMYLNSPSSGLGIAEFIIERPNQADWKNYMFQTWGADGSSMLTHNGGGLIASATNCDGFTIYPASGNLGGKIAIFGISN